MATGGISNPPTIDKPYNIPNIKAFIPLILDLDQLNYDAWCELFQTHCIDFGVVDHIDGSATPETSNSTQWKNLDSILKLWIYGTISQPLLQMVLKRNATVRQVWLNLERLFRDNKDAKAIQLDNELRSISLGDQSITTYCTRIKTIADLLDNIGSSVPEKNLVTYMINGLSSKFDNIATLIRHRSPLPSFLEARSMLLLEEQRMSLSKPPHEFSSALTIESRGFNHRSRHDWWSNQNNRLRRPSSSNPPSHLNFVDHSRGPPTSQAYGWTGTNLVPLRWAPPNSTQQPGLLPTPAVAQSRRQSSNSPSSAWGGPAHSRRRQQQPRGVHQQHNQAHLASGSNMDPPPPWTWFNSDSRDQPTSLPEAFSTMSLNDPGNGGWFMDTGATDHVYADSGLSHPTTTHPM